MAAAVIASALGHPEGPDYLDDGRLVFVETFRGRISAWSRADGVAVYAEPGGGPNACAVGTDGVYVAQNGGTAGEWRSSDPRTPGIERVREDGSVAQITTSAGGDPLVAPNDLAFGPDGRLYFTDPGPFDPERPVNGRVCVAAADGRTEVLVETGPTYPNGIVVEPDGSVVWDESYTRTLRRRRPSGEVELLCTLPEEHMPDGMKLAADGSIFVATITSGGIDVLAPDGSPVGFHATGGEPLNLVFDGTAIVVTDFGELPQYAEGTLASAPACGRLLRLEVGVEGRELYRGAISPAGSPR
jgi:gluconolactonase